jgi:hypothetical protein
MNMNSNEKPQLKSIGSKIIGSVIMLLSLLSMRLPLYVLGEPSPHFPPFLTLAVPVVAQFLVGLNMALPLEFSKLVLRWYSVIMFAVVTFQICYLYFLWKFDAGPLPVEPTFFCFFSSCCCSTHRLWRKGDAVLHRCSGWCFFLSRPIFSLVVFTWSLWSDFSFYFACRLLSASRPQELISPHQVPAFTVCLENSLQRRHAERETSTKEVEQAQWNPIALFPHIPCLFRAAVLAQ